MVTFDYGTWDPTTESIPRRAASGATAQVNEPFTVEHLLFALFSEYTPPVGDPIRTDMVKTLQANLSITLARFRQLGVSAPDLQRLVKAFPSRGLSKDAAALHESRESRGRFANPSGLSIQFQADSKWEARQDATGDIWSLHPKT